MARDTDLPRSDHKRDRPVFRLWWRVALVFAAGIAIAFADTRPGWDDTGVTVFAVLAAAALGAAAGLAPWLSAALVVVPLLAAELSGGPAVLVAVPIALLGAYVTAYVRRQLPGR